MPKRPAVQPHTHTAERVAAKGLHERYAMINCCWHTQKYTITAIFSIINYLNLNYQRFSSGGERTSGNTPRQIGWQ